MVQTERIAVYSVAERGGMPFQWGPHRVVRWGWYKAEGGGATLGKNLHCDFCEKNGPSRVSRLSIDWFICIILAGSGA